MVSYVSAVLYGVGGLVVAGMALLVALQERLVYVPVLPGLTKSYPITPARLRLAYEDVWLRSSDGVRLHAWFIKLFPDSRGPIPLDSSLFSVLSSELDLVVLDFGLDSIRNGNEVRSNPFVLPRKCWKYPTFTIVVFIAKLYYLKCYGASDGYPSQHGITKDAQAALDHLSQRTDIDTSRIVVFGRSLGGAVGTAVTRNNPDKVAALIVENTFTSILDMAGVLLPFLKWFIGGSGSKGPKILNFLVRSPWSTIDIIGEIKQPILFISGLQDEMIPPFQMQTLYAKAAAHNRRCVFVEFPTGMHMDTWLAGGDNYWKTIQQFLQRYVPERKEDESSNGNAGESGGFILSKFCSMVHPELKKLFLLSIEAAAIESAL
ncbi:hypothetical protein TIFTF001_022189 [Ficus carica]|uniref:Peptidase S9 prolyl oligopeptidase catalytic domain-containing protein n=1 Tax=Ficus carica TaxID=3494 RepID=A0AA88DCL5_FICCA|nr:hypothetical protein TIFTF001_022189 [Ficus carica]